MDRWLQAREAIQKSMRPGSRPASEPSAAKPGPNVDQLFVDLFKTDSDDGDSGADIPEAIEPIGALLEKNRNERLLNAGPPRRVWHGIPESGDVIYVEDAIAKILGIGHEDEEAA
jgi:hypothetical protein